jgi:hypothetical protein
MIRIGWIAAMLGAGCAVVLSAAEVRQSTATPSGTALILGQVVDGSNDRPIAGVAVTLGIPAATPARAPTGLQPSGPPPRRVITDANGRFVFTELQAGTYTFSIASASGVMVGGYGMRRPGGTTQLFELAEGQKAADVTLRAWRYGSVAGTVVDQDGDPVVETRVTLLRVETVAGHRRFRVGPTTMTDDRGMYRISRVEPGEYTTYLPYSQVTIPVDVQAAYDSASSQGQVVRQEFERKYGLDSSGVNGSGLRIGEHLLVRASNSFGATGQMGPSFMSPPPDASGRVSVYPMTFYPGVTALTQAATFTVESGQDRAGTDLHTRLVPAVQVSGKVFGPDGPAQMITVRLVAQSAADADNENGIETAKTVTNAAGEFTFLGVPSGSYALKVARVPITTRPTTMTSVTVGGTTMMSVVDDSSLPPLPLPDTPTEYLAMPLVVGDQDIRNLTVMLARGPRLSGRLTYDGNSPQLTEDQLVRVTITLDPVDGRLFPGAAGKGQFEAGGQFRTLGLLPGRYMLRLSGNLGAWSLDSVSTGDKSLPDQPIAIANSDVSGVVITLTDRAGSISGSIRDARGGTDSTATVLVFPANRALWVDTTANPRRLRSARVSTRGAYQITNLPAGDYVVVAIDDRFAADWQRPQQLELLSRSGTRLTIGAADKKTLDLTTQVVR